MDSLLVNPAVQAGIAPFIVSLVIALLLLPLGWRWSALAFLGGMATAIYLTSYYVTGFQVLRITSKEKIFILVFAAAALGLLRDLLPMPSRVASLVLVAAGAGAAAWLLWPLIARKEGAEMWVLLGTTAAYCAWLAAASELVRARNTSTTAAAMALGFGTGGSALLGATAFYGQLGIAIGASASAFALLILVRRVFSLGSVVALPAMLSAGLLAVGAIEYASLSWYSVLPLAAIPLAALIPFKAGRADWLHGIVLLVAMGLLAGLSVFITLQNQGPPPF